MAAPTPEQLNQLGPLINPFERNPLKRPISAGEADLFEEHIFDATSGDLPPNCVKSTTASIAQQGREGRYLWVVDQNSLKIILEATPNIERSPSKIVCHTNITGGKPALHGGELWFGTDDKVYINNASGRYGNSETTQWDAVLDYFRAIGYDVVALPFLLR